MTARPERCPNTLSGWHIDEPNNVEILVCVACGVRPTQPLLVDPGRPPAPRDGADIARTSDAETSKAAAERLTRSGRRNSIKDKVYRAVLATPGLNRSEIAAKTGLREEQVWRRISDLKNDRLVRYGEPVDGQQTVWPGAATR